MTYTNIRKAKFISRPNRFIANIEIDGQLEICHVKNTGRCKELLTDNATIFVQEFDNANRKTKFDLISVYKGETLINMDSQVPNKVFAEWAQSEKSIFKNITLLKPESTYKNSRFDFFMNANGKNVYIEVKGVTLEDDGVARFPDAPTLRGIKHLNELAQSVKEGFEAFAIFIIQMKGIKHFEPNVKTHAEFATALKTSQDCGVKLIALDCEVTENSIVAADFVDIKI